MGMGPGPCKTLLWVPGVPHEPTLGCLEYPWSTLDYPVSTAYGCGPGPTPCPTVLCKSPTLVQLGARVCAAWCTTRRAACSWTALMWAAYCGHVDVMAALMYFGADQSKRAQHGRYSGCAFAAFSYNRQSCTGHKVRVVS